MRAIVASCLVIGMVATKARLEGTGFALPADDVAAFLLAGTNKQGEDGAIDREWLDASGQHRIGARYLGTVAESLALRRTDGQEILVPIDQLSPPNQAFVRLLNQDRYPNPITGLSR